MAHHPVYSLPVGTTDAKLLLTPCPGTQGIPLQQSLRELKEQGAAMVLTLMQQEELERFNVAAIEKECVNLGLEWLHLPIQDEKAPSEAFGRLWQTASAKVGKSIARGGNVVVHCKGGSGRTGMVAAHILVEHGVCVEQAMLKIKALRPKAFKHKVQIEYTVRLPQKSV